MMANVEIIVPPGYLLLRYDANGLMPHRSDWRLVRDAPEIPPALTRRMTGT